MALPHIILFADKDCTGAHAHICDARSYIGDEWNDKLSSFIILEGRWEFFDDVGFAKQLGGRGRSLGPGVYNWIEDVGALGPGTDDKMSCLRPI